jgi:hypothetical protein
MFLWIRFVPTGYWWLLPALVSVFGLSLWFFRRKKKPCLYCEEWIPKDATDCPHCQRAVEQMFDARCPVCGERGQLRESLLNDSTVPLCGGRRDSALGLSAGTM